MEKEREQKQEQQEEEEWEQQEKQQQTLSLLESGLCSAHRLPVCFPPAVPGRAAGDPAALTRRWSGTLGAAALLWDPLVSSLAEDLPLLDAVTT